MSNYIVKKYPHGTFCWADLATTDVAKAKDFYTAVFGWEAEDLPINETELYNFMKKDGHTVAGLAQMQPEMQAQGMMPHWSNYISVDDVDATTAKAKALGANVLADSFDVQESGRMSIIQDPTGANIGLWQAKSHIGASLVNVPGAMSWNQLLTKEVDKAKDFYGQLFGWKAAQDATGYLSFTNNGRPAAGVMTIGEDWGNVPSHWQVFLAVADLEAAFEVVKAKGGQVMGEIFEFAGVARLAPVVDPTGGGFVLTQPLNPQPWED